ncbi:MAG: N-formylglutamate amidohydrolase [Bdellovibrionaceae bacterium]|nr:N-formylglutamate amidohydrolase [Pseudobdellovibrionaceae bacterium]
MKDIPLFVSIPHSGFKIPKEAYWLKNLPFSILMCDVDAYVDDLYLKTLKNLHIPFFSFKWHRYAVDANRFQTDISSQTVERARELLKTIYKNKEFRQKNPSNIHWHKTTKGKTLIKKAISQDTHKKLIKKYLNPFKLQIQKKFESFKSQGHKTVYLLDLHSMPSKGLAFHKDRGSLRPDIVIGNNRGQSCSKKMTNLVVKAYRKAGFKVALNWPYKGGAITYTYGQPHKGQEVLQVELNRKLYMDEKTKKKSKNYKNIQIRLNLAVQKIVEGIRLF